MNHPGLIPRAIKMGDIVLHTLTGLYYKCENQKHERWMNMNNFYILADRSAVPESYFTKTL